MKAMFFFAAHLPGVALSCMKVNMLGRTTLEALVNMKTYFNPLKSRGSKQPP